MSCRSVNRIWHVIILWYRISFIVSVIKYHQSVFVQKHVLERLSFYIKADFGDYLCSITWICVNNCKLVFRQDIGILGIVFEKIWLVYITYLDICCGIISTAICNSFCISLG